MPTFTRHAIDPSQCKHRHPALPLAPDAMLGAVGWAKFIPSGGRPLRLASTLTWGDGGRRTCGAGAAAFHDVRPAVDGQNFFRQQSQVGPLVEARSGNAISCGRDGKGMRWGMGWGVFASLVWGARAWWVIGGSGMGGGELGGGVHAGGACARWR